MREIESSKNRGMPILDDLLDPNLKVVFCGSAAGDKSAKARAYYAGPQNKFWDVLHRVGLTPKRLLPPDFRKLLKRGIGLTDLAKGVSGTDDKISFRKGDRMSLESKISNYRPRGVAFNGKRAAQEYFRCKVNYGRQNEQMESSVVFVLPSTSAATRRFWNERFWKELARFLGKVRTE